VTLKPEPNNSWRNLYRLSAAALATAILAGCAANSNLDPLGGIGFREARFEEISLMREYRACREEGFSLDKKARSSGSAAMYLASARVLEKCEATVGPDFADGNKGERMRAYALSTQNYFKGGDVSKARETFDKFKARFPENDLYYPDGTSFITTMDALLGREGKWSFSEFSTLNVNGTMKSEMRRALYWKNK